MSLQHKNTIMKICSDYGITAAQLKTAAAFQLITGGSLEGSDDLEGMAKRVAAVMDDTGVAGTLKWATWVKKAQETKQPGVDVDELLKIGNG